MSAEGLSGYFGAAADVWEMQSFLKTRAVAGDAALGRRAVRQVEEVILERASAMPPPELAAAVGDMRRRLADAWCGAAGARRPKHGPGGLFDIDFAIEYLQLRHRIAGPDLKDTPHMLALLRDRGHLGASEYAALYEGERFLRVLDHETRLIHGGALEALPSDPARLSLIAAALDRIEDPPAAADLPALYDRRASAVRRAFETVLSG